MCFGGETSPLAFLELMSLGLSEDQTPALSAALCELFDETLAIPSNRVYIEFTSPPRHLLGFDGKTFSTTAGSESNLATLADVAINAWQRGQNKTSAIKPSGRTAIQCTTSEKTATTRPTPPAILPPASRSRPFPITNVIRDVFTPLSATS